MSCQRGWHLEMGGGATLRRRILITLPEPGDLGQYPQSEAPWQWPALPLEHGVAGEWPVCSSPNPQSQSNHEKNTGHTRTEGRQFTNPPLSFSLLRSPETRRFWETVTAKKSLKETRQLKVMMCPGWDPRTEKGHLSGTKET